MCDVLLGMHGVFICSHDHSGDHRMGHLCGLYWNVHIDDHLLVVLPGSTYIIEVRQETEKGEDESEHITKIRNQLHSVRETGERKGCRYVHI